MQTVINIKKPRAVSVTVVIILTSVPQRNNLKEELHVLVHVFRGLIQSLVVWPHALGGRNVMGAKVCGRRELVASWPKGK